MNLASPPSHEPLILQAWSLEKGQVKPITEEGRLVAQLEASSPAWVHLSAKQYAPAQQWLSHRAGYLSEALQQALLEPETRPRMVEHDDGVLLILRGVNLNPDSRPEDMVSIRLYVDASRVISLQRRNLNAVQDVAERLMHANHHEGGAGMLVCYLSDALLSRMEPVIQRLNDAVDDLEERVMLAEKGRDIRNALIQHRRQAITLRRYLTPQREALNRLKIHKAKWLKDHHKIELQEQTDRLLRYLEDLEELRERTQIIQDELMNALSEQMNRVMYLLSIISTVFLPLSFATGLFGMNVAGLPWLEDSHGFAYVCLIMAGVALCLLTLFRLRKWL